MRFEVLFNQGEFDADQNWTRSGECIVWTLEGEQADVDRWMKSATCACTAGNPTGCCCEFVLPSIPSISPSCSMGQPGAMASWYVVEIRVLTDPEPRLAMIEERLGLLEAARG